MKMLLLPGSSWHRWTLCVCAATSLLSSYTEVADIMHQSQRRSEGGARATAFWLSVECVVAGLDARLYGGAFTSVELLMR